jgi:Flp pilus assembly protein TadD
MNTPILPQLMRSAALIVLLIAFLGGCATVDNAANHASTFDLQQQSIFADARHATSSTLAKPQRANEIFAIDDDMRRYLQEHVLQQEKIESMYKANLRQALVEALAAGGQMRLDYDASVTRTARETFYAKSGNCLSLTIMAAGMARALGLNVFFQQVHANTTWGRQDNVQFSIGHVNLVVGEHLPSIRSRLGKHALHTIDFMPVTENAAQRTTAISEATLLAMFMNNRAAELLTTGETSAAYWHAREAVLHDPHYAAARVTLAVIHRRAGDMALSERALQSVLQVDPYNTIALSNMVSLMLASARADEATQYQARLTKLQPVPPFHHLDLGKRAMEAGDVKLARDHFLRERNLGNESHEVHFWLANAYYRLGERRLTQNHLNLAQDFSPTRQMRALYAAKRQALDDKRQASAIQ